MLKCKYQCDVLISELDRKTKHFALGETVSVSLSWLFGKIRNVCMFLIFEFVIMKMEIGVRTVMW